jgi:aspartate kinase
MQKGLTLLTIRHYDADTLASLTQGQKEVLRQQTNDTVQLLLQTSN